MADWGHLDEAAEARRKVDSPEVRGLPHPDELLLIGADPEDFPAGFREVRCRRVVGDDRRKTIGGGH